jgi:hypothetical protein
VPKIDQILGDVERLVQTVKPREAEEKLRSLISTMGDEELKMWEADLRLTIDRFLPKRRKSLTLVLDRRLASDGASPPTLKLGSQEPKQESPLGPLQMAFAEELQDLSEHHIFQWSTFYRDTLSLYFDRFLTTATDASQRDDALRVMRELLSNHSQEIFEKGFRYLSSQAREVRQYAVTKSTNGLQRFLDLPIEFYSAKDTVVAPSDAQVLRAVCSAMLRGILEGYANASLGESSGGQLLPRYPRSWGYSLAFLSDSDLEPLLDAIEPGEFRDVVTRAVRPVIQALDELSTRVGDYVPLTALAQFNWERRRLDASIQPPPYASEPQLIDIQCYLGESYVSRRDLEEAANRGVGVVVAPLRADLRAVVNESERLRRIVVAAGEDEAGLGAARQRVISALEYAIYRRRSPRLGAQPLQYNFATEFPLHNPFLTRYFHVYRSSVRELLRTFEQRNGVRLWCSIRRSGKTTACLDLGTTTGRSVIVSQTCETTGQLPDGSVFYDSVCDALTEGKQLPATYFADLVQRAAPEHSAIEDRVVFVLDEYETLFGRLKSAVAREPDLRYTVAQPLLNQMVAFTRDNLLVFLGQQPNAHFIFMDQNQLSAYVQQDSFPLFRHDEGTPQGELSELVRKVLTERVSVDPTFVDGVYSETAGHPYLTVNLLVEFVEWLIEKKRPVSSLHLDRDDFEKFAKQQLRPKKVSLSPEYRFFREAISEALSSEARAATPWLHAIYTCVRGVVRASPESLSCSLADFEEIVERARLPEIGMDADLLLTTGSQANFLEHDEREVKPKIRLLARLAAVTRGRVAA